MKQGNWPAELKLTNHCDPLVSLAFTFCTVSRLSHITPTLTSFSLWSIDYAYSIDDYLSLD